jgi:hypothetical protein
MNVNKKILLKRINSQASGSGKAFYDWRAPTSMDFTGDINAQHLIDLNSYKGAVYNLFVDPDKYFIEAQTAQPLAEALLCFPVGVSQVDSILDDKGTFDGDCALLIAGSSGIKNWTAFFDLSSDCPVDKSKSRILFSNKNNLNNSEGFIFGLNGANSLFYESINKDGERNIKTLYKSIGEKSLVIVSKGENEISLSIYNPVYQKTNTQVFEIEEKESSNSFTIGGLEGENLQQNQEYAGFSGEINNFVLLNKFISSEKINIISEAFFLTDYQERQYQDTVSNVPAPGRTVERQVKDGLEIVGYAYQPKEIPATSGGGVVTIFSKIPVKKPKLKTVTQFQKGEGFVSKVTHTLVPESKTYDPTHFRSYAEKCVLLDADENKADVVEIYSFSEAQNNLNKVAKFNVGDKTFKLDQSYASGININIYLNKKIQEKDIDYQIVDGITIKKLQGAYFELDEMTYDVASGSNPVEAIDFDGYGGNIYWYGWQNKDVYLDGKKLINGLDYWTHIDLFLVVRAAGLSPGRMVFVDKIADIANTNYTNDKYAHCQSFNIISEMIWIGGLRASKGSEYALTCVCDLNNSENAAPTKEALIYNNEGSFFNIY